MRAGAATRVPCGRCLVWAHAACGTRDGTPKGALETAKLVTAVGFVSGGRPQVGRLLFVLRENDAVTRDVGNDREARSWT